MIFHAKFNIMASVKIGGQFFVFKNLGKNKGINKANGINEMKLPTTFKNKYLILIVCFKKAVI